MRPIFLLLGLFFFLSGNAQSLTPPDAVNPSPAPDSACYIQLKNGQNLYSRHVRLKSTDTSDTYLYLDNDRHIPIGQVIRYRSPAGSFIPIPGSSGTDIYRVEREGPKISLYSRLLIDPDHSLDSGYTPTRLFYFRKPGQ